MQRLSFLSLQICQKLVNLRVAWVIGPGFASDPRTGYIGWTQPQTLTPVNPSTPLPLEPLGLLNNSTTDGLPERSISPSSRLCPTGTRLVPFAEPRSPLKRSDRRHG